MDEVPAFEVEILSKMRKQIGVAYAAPCPQKQLIVAHYKHVHGLWHYKFWKPIKVRSRKMIKKAVQKIQEGPDFNPMQAYDSRFLAGTTQPEIVAKAQLFRIGKDLELWDIGIDHYDTAKATYNADSTTLRQVAGTRHVFLHYPTPENDSATVYLSEDTHITQDLRIPEMQSWHPMRHTKILFVCDINGNQKPEFVQIGFGYESTWFSVYELESEAAPKLLYEFGFGL